MCVLFIEIKQDYEYSGYYITISLYTAPNVEQAF